MELELCLERREDLLPFFKSILQTNQLVFLRQQIDKPIVVSFLLTHLTLEELHSPNAMTILCEIVISLFKFDFESPSLTLDGLRPMKAAIKELAPRSIPSLVRLVRFYEL